MSTEGAAVRSPSLFDRVRDVWETVGNRIPRRIKLAIVWVIIAAALFGVFVALGLDISWMREKAHFIISGVGLTIYVSVAAMALAIPLALLGA
ncbi:MAG: hypothetical protein M3O88_08425, partial [Actinomycetota bacterium]|nr:hypothetical protein [Actinomycetota bacterium]